MPMSRAASLALVVCSALTSLHARAAPGSLEVAIEGVSAGARMPDRFSFCRPVPSGHVALGENRSLPLHWSAGPAGTRSYAVVMVDPDVPAQPEDVNKEGRTIPESAERAPFYHWLLANIPPATHQLPEGGDSMGVTPRGKPPGPAPSGLRGVNDYSGFLASDSGMAGTYGGYDGPCPPWNDLRVHHYTTSVYALDVPALDLPAGFAGADLLTAMKGHVLASGSMTTTYTTQAGTAPGNTQPQGTTP